MIYTTAPSPSSRQGQALLGLLPHLTPAPTHRKGSVIRAPARARPSYSCMSRIYGLPPFLFFLGGVTAAEQVSICFLWFRD